MTDDISFQSPGSQRRWTLSGTTLSWSGAKVRGEAPLADVQSITVRFVSMAAANAPDLRQCLVVIRGHKRQVIASQDWGTPDAAGDRVEQYAAFVRALIARSRAANPSLRLLSGSNWMWYAWLTMFVLLAAFTLLYVGSLLRARAYSWDALLPLAVMLAFLATVWPGVRAGGARRIDPDDLPADIIGG